MAGFNGKYQGLKFIRFALFYFNLKVAVFASLFLLNLTDGGLLPGYNFSSRCSLLSSQL